MLLFWTDLLDQPHVVITSQQLLVKGHLETVQEMSSINSTMSNVQCHRLLCTTTERRTVRVGDR